MEQLNAYHEAGHAVIAYRFGYSLQSINILPDKKRNGICYIYGKPDGNPEQEILILAAGDAAQKVKDPNDDSEPSITDYRKIWSITDKATLPSGSYNRLLQEAKDLVIENWKAIESLAEALLEIKELEGLMHAFIINCVDSGQNWRETEDWKAISEYYHATKEL